MLNSRSNVSSHGTIKIRPLTAKLKRDTEFFGKMSPYCLINFAGKKEQTQPHGNAGKFPSWKQTLEFFKTNEESFDLQVWDKDKLKKDDLVGEANISLFDLFAQKKQESWFLLSYKGKNAGEILLNMEFIPVDTSSNINTSQQSQGQHQQYNKLNSLPNAQTQQPTQQGRNQFFPQSNTMVGGNPYQQQQFQGNQYSNEELERQKKLKQFGQLAQAYTQEAIQQDSYQNPYNQQGQNQNYQQSPANYPNQNQQQPYQNQSNQNQQPQQFPPNFNNQNQQNQYNFSEDQIAKQNMFKLLAQQNQMGNNPQNPMGNNAQNPMQQSYSQQQQYENQNYPPQQQNQFNSPYNSNQNSYNNNQNPYNNNQNPYNQSNQSKESALAAFAKIAAQANAFQQNIPPQNNYPQNNQQQQYQQQQYPQQNNQYQQQQNQWNQSMNHQNSGEYNYPTQ